MFCGVFLEMGNRMGRSKYKIRVSTSTVTYDEGWYNTRGDAQAAADALSGLDNIKRVRIMKSNSMGEIPHR